MFEMTISTGIITRTAASRGRTRILAAGMFMVVRASTSWYTVIEASSAVIAEPTLPARSTAVIMGPSSRAIERPTRLPMYSLAPKSCRE